MLVTSVFCALVMWAGIDAADRPCAARKIPDYSVVCVCNDTYCDDITREIPTSGNFVYYTSSEGGSRFKRNEGLLQNLFSANLDNAPYAFVIDPTSTSQTIEGFGGAVTDAAGIHWYDMSPQLKENFVKSYFGKNGLEYNMLRVPIGGCDFSTHDYAYNELPVDDINLTNFSLAPEDFKYKIPLIHQIMETAPAEIHIVSTVWSPPAWMKTDNTTPAHGFLKSEYYQTYADYHVKFVREYNKRGIKIWGLTTTNEPSDGLTGIFGMETFQHLAWTSDTLGNFISGYFGPTIRNSSDTQNIKILSIDDQRYTIPYYFTNMVHENPDVLNWIDGVAVHWYADSSTPAEFLEQVTLFFPDKFVINTEACEGSFPWQENVVLGDWRRAQAYADDIIQDLNFQLIGWIDWNLVLDKQGGPNWVKNYVDSAIIAFPEHQEFVKQPMFYAMGHFAKWIPRGSVRLEVIEIASPGLKPLHNVAVQTPNNTVVFVVHNKGPEQNITIQIDSQVASLPLERNSITTVEIPYDSDFYDVAGQVAALYPL